MKKLILTLAFAGSFSQMVVAQEIEATLSDTDLTQIQDNICYFSHPTIPDETAIGNPLSNNNLGQYTYTKTELEYVRGDDDDDEGYYRKKTVTVSIDSTEIDSTIRDNLSNPSAQDEISNVCI
ncbi:MAG: hypothetical protein QNJ60_07425 [Xenococcaceae cyanobacterium MO_188.B19]|nr:hypothetical protein [Xenococcaceae cyanobacterium MO_188.B19]